MTDLSRDKVRHLAALARINLSERELESMVSDLEAIVRAVEIVQNAATPDVNPTSHPIPLGNVFRNDEVETALGQEDVLAGSPEREGAYFRVNSILGDAL
tara:strand:+ start:170 stop:469 length:300 start_codon:yes stop_codon:yes gene_type:complete